MECQTYMLTACFQMPQPLSMRGAPYEPCSGCTGSHDPCTVSPLSSAVQVASTTTCIKIGLTLQAVVAFPGNVHILLGLSQQ